MAGWTGEWAGGPRGGGTGAAAGERRGVGAVVGVVGEVRGGAGKRGWRVEVWRGERAGSGGGASCLSRGDQNYKRKAYGYSSARISSRTPNGEYERVSGGNMMCEEKILSMEDGPLIFPRSRRVE